MEIRDLLSKVLCVLRQHRVLASSLRPWAMNTVSICNLMEEWIFLRLVWWSICNRLNKQCYDILSSLVEGSRLGRGYGVWLAHANSNTVLNHNERSRSAQSAHPMPWAAEIWKEFFLPLCLITPGFEPVSLAIIVCIHVWWRLHRLTNYRTMCKWFSVIITLRKILVIRSWCLIICLICCSCHHEQTCDALASWHVAVERRILETKIWCIWAVKGLASERFGWRSVLEGNCTHRYVSLP